MREASGHPMCQGETAFVPETVVVLACDNNRQGIFKVCGTVVNLLYVLRALLSSLFYFRSFFGC
jgi:hypothetical protein